MGSDLRNKIAGASGVTVHTLFRGNEAWIARIAVTVLGVPRINECPQKHYIHN